MKILFVLTLLLGSLAGCATVEDLDNVVRVRSGSVQTEIPYVRSEIDGVSIQTKGRIGYKFRIKYTDGENTVEVVNVGEIPEN